MKRNAFVFCFLAALLLPAAILLFRSAGETPAVTSKPAPPAVSAKAAMPARSPEEFARAAQAQAETVRQFVETIGAWENAAGLEGDRLEQKLRDAIDDENAEVLLRALPPRFHGTYVGNLLLARWAVRDRAGALRWLAAQKSPTLFEVNAVTKGWAARDREGLGRYVERLPPSAWKSLVLESTGRDALANHDPELAFGLLRGMDEGPAKGPLIADAARQWAQSDPRSVVEEIDRLPGPALRERLILAAASGYATVNPGAAAEWLRQSFPDGATLDCGLAGVMQAWTSAGDPATGAQWIMELPVGSTRDHAFRALIAAWSEDDAETFKDWLNALPEGPLRAQADATLGSLASLP